MAEKLTSKIKAFQVFVGTDCCGTGRNYDKVSVTEMKEFKDSITPEEWDEFSTFALNHINAH